MAGRDGREFAWRTAVVRRLAGMQRGNAGSPQPRAWVQPPWSPGDAVMSVEPHQAGRDSGGEAHGPTRRGRNFALAQGSRLSQREGTSLSGFLGHHKLCGVPGSASPIADRGGWGLSRAGGHVCRAGHSLIVGECRAFLPGSTFPLAVSSA